MGYSLLSFDAKIETIDEEIKELRMSVSIGVTFNDMNDLEEMINQADKALYVAKKNGRNRVEVA